MTSLPHKRIEETVWRRSSPNTTLLVASGHTEEGHPISWLRVSSTAERAQIDQCVGHQFHAVVPLLFELEA